MRAVWAMVVFGAFIVALAVAAGTHPVWITLFGALWVAVFVPLVRGVRRTRAPW